MTRLITIFDKNLNQRVFRLFDENEIVHKIDTNLTISASSTSIDVGNNVELTGVLTDENSVPLGGMSVRILKNNVLLDTVTTNSSGVYSKIITGLDIGTYHFHVSYAGNDVYDNALSETVDVSVVGHTYAVTITADKQSILTTESVTITGTVTRDGTGYAGQSVRIFDSGVLVDTVTTDANGDYTKTMSNLTQGTHRFSSQYDAYESSIAVVEVVEHNYSIDIVADNPIIQSGDTSIITATLLDGTDPVINESLSYTLSNKGTVVGSGSALTNSNGEISITYVGAGLGDIDVEVSYGTLLQETFVVQDYHWYDDATSDKSSSFVTLTGQNPTIVHNTDHYTITSDSNGNNYVYLGTEEYDNISFEVTLKMHNWNSGIAICGDNGLEGLTSLAFCANDYIYWTFFSSTMNWDLIMKERPFIQNEVYYKLTHTISGNSYTYKIEDMNGNVLKSLQGTYSLPHKRLALAVLGNGGSIDVKDIKVKAL